MELEVTKEACMQPLEAALEDGQAGEQLAGHALRCAEALQRFYTNHPDELPPVGTYSASEPLYAMMEERDGGPPPVRLVRSTWIKARAAKIRAAGSASDRRAFAMPRRQQLEHEDPSAFISAEELRELRWPRGQDHRHCIGALSYCWLTPQHPDPEGEQLVALADSIQEEEIGHLQHSTGEHFPHEAGFFIDFMSVCQKDESGERTPQEQQAFAAALGNMQVWYAHELTTTFRIRQLPETYGELPGYDARGWTTCESQWSMLAKRQEGGCVPPIFDIGGGRRRVRDPPLDPASMAQLLAQRRFTSQKSDLPTVIDINVRTILSVFRDVTVLFYSPACWDDEDVLQLCKALPLATNVKELWVTGSDMTDVGALNLAKWVATTKTLENLDLNGHRIGRMGKSALHSAADANARLSGRKIRMSIVQQKPAPSSAADRWPSKIFRALPGSTR